MSLFHHKKVFIKEDGGGGTCLRLCFRSYLEENVEEEINM
jgi:hypothetical protein